MPRRLLTGTILVVLFALLLITAPGASRLLESAPAPPEKGERDEGEGEGKRFDRPDEFEAYHDAIRRPDLPGAAGADLGYEVGYQARALEAALEGALGKGGSVALPWQEHGPTNVAGRARALLVDVRDATSNTWFLGSAGGGIWKTTNGGLSWTNSSGDMPNLSVSTLAQSAAAPNVLYAGTGEGMGNVDAVFGAGIFKSTDGGATWSLLTSTANGNFRAVNRLVVSPTDANNLVAATTAGVLRSTDGGANWVMRQSGSFHQVVATADYSALYASRSGNCAAPNVYRSTDGGNAWTLANAGMPGGRRTEIAIAPSAPNRLYASIEGCESSPVSRLAVSNDAGSSWIEVAVSGSGSTSTTSARSWLAGQGWYDNAIGVNPFNPDQVYVGGLDLYRGTVAGASSAAPTVALARTSVWSASSTSSTYAHADHHSYVPIITNAATQAWKLLITTDGGAFESTLPTATTMAWTARNAGLNTTQFYGADKMIGTLRFVAGAQDNGSYLSISDPGATAPWTRTVGGDGFDAVAGTGTNYFASLYNNRIVRFQNGGSAELSNFADAGQGSFITQIAKTDGDPNRLYVTGPSGVWRTDDFGDSWSLGVFRNRLSGGFDRWGYSASRMPITASSADARIIWAGARMSSNERRLFVSTDGGATFDTTRISPEIYNLAATATSCPGTAAARCGAGITGLATHPTQPNTAYALFSVQGYAKILRTTDLGRTWTNLSGTFATTDAVLSSNGFPNVAVYSLMAFPYAPSRLWAGTEIGLFVSENGGATWSKDTSGLPPVAVWQMRMVDGRVVVATHGRGVWSVDLPSDFNGYRPTPVLLPSLTGVGQRPDGRLFVRGVARQGVDSLVVRLGSRIVQRTLNVAHGTTVTLDVPPALLPTGVNEVQLIGYKGGQPYSSGIRTLTLAPLKAPVEALALDFSSAADVQLEGLLWSQPVGFASPGLHTPHPYPDATTFTATILQPIRISAAGTTIRYRDIAILEPCVDGSAYCNGGGKYDTVVLEATSDGANWTTLVGPLDAASNPAWMNTYVSSSAGAEANMVEHLVIPSRYYPVGTVLLLRFRVTSDPNTNGWGWAADDLRIDAGITATEGAASATALDLLAPTPNPTRQGATVAVTMPAPADVRVRVYDVQGRLITTLAEGPMPAGRHSLAFDAARVAPGVYLIRLESEGIVRTRSLTVTR